MWNSSSCVASLPPTKLDVVDQQRVRRAVARPELLLGALLDRGHKVVRELLRGDVGDLPAGANEAVADALQQVRLAEADRPVQEQRVVQRAGRVRHAFGGGEGEVVARADDERVEDVAGVQPRARVDGPRRLGRAAALEQGRVVRGRLQGLERDLQGPIGEIRERAHDQWTQPLLQPFGDELRARADDQRGAVEAYALRVGEPGLVVGFRNVLPEVAQCGLPELRRVVLHPRGPPVLLRRPGATTCAGRPRPVRMSTSNAHVLATRPRDRESRLCLSRASHCLAPAIPASRVTLT